ASWDVADLKGREAVLEIVDRSSAGWGHINIDRIIFSDVPPEPLLRRGTAIEAVVQALPLGFSKAEEAALPAGSSVTIDSITVKKNSTPHDPPLTESQAVGWTITRYTRLGGFHSGEHGYR